MWLRGSTLVRGYVANTVGRIVVSPIPSSLKRYWMTVSWPKDLVMAFAAGASSGTSCSVGCLGFSV